MSGARAHFGAVGRLATRVGTCPARSPSSGSPRPTPSTWSSRRADSAATWSASTTSAAPTPACPGLSDLTEDTRITAFTLGLSSASHRAPAARAAADGGWSTPSRSSTRPRCSRRRLPSRTAPTSTPAPSSARTPSIGCHANVNRSSSIGHDARLGFAVSTGPGVVLAGSVVVGAGAFIGSGATDPARAGRSATAPPSGPVPWSRATSQPGAVVVGQPRPGAAHRRTSRS